jgi:putative inorganic carbon (hco3(-)) transporter
MHHANLSDSRAERTGGGLLPIAVLGPIMAIWLGPTTFLTLPGMVLAAVLLAWTGLRVARGVPLVWLVAVGGLLVTALVGLYPSIDVGTSLTRLYGLVVGVTLVTVLLVGLRNRRALTGVAVVLLLLALTLAFVSLVGTNWPTGGKGLNLGPIYDRLPRVLGGLTRSEEAGIHPNKLAAPIAMLCAVGVAGLLFGGRRWIQVGWGVAVAMLLPLLVLMQSRSALLAVAGGILLVLAIRWRPLRLLFIPFAAGLALLLFSIATPELAEGVWTAPRSNEGDVSLSFSDRREVWRMALAMISDFPMTGAGLGMFQPVSDLLYGRAFIFSKDVSLPHAHNLALQVAVDQGLPGLVFFILLSGCLVVTVRAALRNAGSPELRGLAAGASGGLLAYYVFGVTDAVGLGEKPGIIFWLLVAVIAAVARVPRVVPGSEPIGPTSEHHEAEPRITASHARGHLSTPRSAVAVSQGGRPPDEQRAERADRRGGGRAAP